MYKEGRNRALNSDAVLSTDRFKVVPLLQVFFICQLMQLCRCILPLHYLSIKLRRCFAFVLDAAACLYDFTATYLMLALDVAMYLKFRRGFKYLSIKLRRYF